MQIPNLYQMPSSWQRFKCHICKDGDNKHCDNMLKRCREEALWCKCCWVRMYKVSWNASCKMSKCCNINIYRPHLQSKDLIDLEGNGQFLAVPCLNFMTATIEIHGAQRDGSPWRGGFFYCYTDSVFLACGCCQLHCVHTEFCQVIVQSLVQGLDV